MFAKSKDKLLTGKDWFGSNEATICMRCKHFIGSDRTRVQQHAKSSLPAANVSGSSRQFADFTIRAEWLEPTIDEEEIAKADSDLALEAELKNTQLKNTEAERTVPVVPENASAAEEASRKRRESEDRLRHRRQEGTLIANEGNLEERLHHSSPSPSQSDDNDINIEDGIGNPDLHNFKFTVDEINKFVDKALSWSHRCGKDEDEIIIFPKIWGDRLKKVKKTFLHLFETKIKSLIQKYDAFLINMEVSESY